MFSSVTNVLNPAISDSACEVSSPEVADVLASLKGKQDHNKIQHPEVADIVSKLLSKHRTKSPPVVDICEDPDDDAVVKNQPPVTTTPVCADTESTMNNRSNITSEKLPDKTTQPPLAKVKDISSSTPYCKDLNIPSVFSDTPSDRQSKEPGEIRSDDDCDTSDTTEDILDSIDLPDTGLLNDVVVNDQSTNGKTDNINCDQGKPLSNVPDPRPVNQKTHTVDGTNVVDQDHINDNHTDQTSLQKEPPLGENENDVSDKTDVILPPDLTIAVNNSTENTNGKPFTKAKQEPMTDSNNTTESSEIPTSSEPSVVYGTQPGIISDTPKEMHKNLI